MTAIAVAGFAVGVHAGLFRGALLWLGFSGTYFLALYWYHLTCFGEYYYQELNSIPRFTRVPLQMFHALGLVLLIVGSLRLAAAHWRSQSGSPLFGGRPPLAICLALIVGLGAWQVRQTYRSVVDLTTRLHQNADPRIAEMRNAADYVRRHAGRELPDRPTLAILGQGQDADVRGYASYFAQGPAPRFSTCIGTAAGRRREEEPGR